MNEVFRRRLIGLAVLLVLTFVLSLLLPQDDSSAPAVETPSTTVSLDDSKPPPGAPPATSALPAPSSPTPAKSTVELMPAISALADEPEADGKSKPVPPPAAAAPKNKGPALKLSPTVSTPAAKQEPAGSPRSAVAAPAPSLPAKPAVIAKAAPVLSPPKPKLAESVTKPPVPAPASAPTTASGWYVQIGSFSDQGKADTIIALLQKIGYKAESSRIANSAGVTLHRVRIGAYATEASAAQAQQRVARQGYPQARVIAEGNPAK